MEVAVNIPAIFPERQDRNGRRNRISESIAEVLSINRFRLRGKMWSIKWRRHNFAMEGVIAYL